MVTSGIVAIQLFNAIMVLKGKMLTFVSIQNNRLLPSALYKTFNGWSKTVRILKSRASKEQSWKCPSRTSSAATGRWDRTYENGILASQSSLARQGMRMQHFRPVQKEKPHYVNLEVVSHESQLYYPWKNRCCVLSHTRTTEQTMSELSLCILS